MAEQPALMGREAMTGGPLRLQGACVILEGLFHGAARTRAVPGASLGAGLRPIAHANAGGAPLSGARDLAHHPARVRPRPGLGAGRVHARALAPIARLGPLGLLDALACQRLQDALAGQTRALLEMGVGRAPLQHCGRGNVAVTTTEDAGSGPSRAPGLDQPCHPREPLRTRAPLRLELPFRTPI